MTCAGFIFGFVGKEIVDIISNGKFAAAAAYIPALFVIALIQTTERPANAIVCASDRAASATWTRTVMALGSFIALFPIIVLFGIKGSLRLASLKQLHIGSTCAF